MAEFYGVEYAHIEIDEAGTVWLIQNLDYQSVIWDMENSESGYLVVDDSEFYDEFEAYDEYLADEPNFVRGRVCGCSSCLGY